MIMGWGVSSSLRLIVPPVQLVSAALWEIVKQGAVMYYGLLEEFIASVLETVPELLAHTERVQLVLGLRARTPSAEVIASVTNFQQLVHILVDDRFQRDVFYQHQSKHREQQPDVCSYCGKQFSRPQDLLKVHMVRHTGGYPCPVCGKKFFQKTYLKWHLYKHTGQEPYLCDTCGKGWPSAAQLRLHMVQRTEERPFKCEDRGMCYKRKSHLTAHRRDKHIRLRPFMCEVCRKAFRLNSMLKKHMMIHTGERPHACPKCGKTFIKKTRLREHREKA
ncbi:hypothetical protein INR49_010693, partial [Caranx melampygus]